MTDTDDWADEKARALLHNLRLANFYSLTEAEVLPVIASALRDVRREALEEAALVAERNPEPYIPMRIRALAAGGKAK